MAAIKSEVELLKKSLEKEILSDAPSESAIWDILVALKKIPMTIDILRETMVGKTIHKVEKKFPSGNRLNKEAEEIKNLWKKQCDIATKSSKSTESVEKGTSSEKPVEAKKSDTDTSTANGNGQADKSTAGGTAEAQADGGDDDDDLGADELYEALVSGRKKMVDILSEHLSQNTTKGVAKMLSCHIETSIHNLYDFMADKKAYMDKFRSLSYNMKINEGLRKEIVEGRLMPESLVRLSPQEMATEEQRKKIDDVLRNEFMSRRTDYYETHRADILRANGIDPNKGGEFTCSRCKGTKTSHYSLQTRSSDEPMTVFVQCLTCGKRWRTQ